MAIQQHQQQDFRQGQQHLAQRQQENSAQPVRLVHQLQQHLHQALAEVQALERQRLSPQQQEQYK